MRCGHCGDIGADPRMGCPRCGRITESVAYCAVHKSEWPGPNCPPTTEYPNGSKEYAECRLAR